MGGLRQVAICRNLTEAENLVASVGGTVQNGHCRDLGTYDLPVVHALTIITAITYPRCPVSLPIILFVHRGSAELLVT